MTRVVVLGAGYAGTGAVQILERRLGDETELTWVSDRDYHLVLHEVHRVIRDPEARDAVTVPVEEIKRPDTTFTEGEVTGIDTDERRVALGDGSEVPYDYLLVALGSGTAFYGIPGLAEHAQTLKGLDDALAIHEAVREAAEAATREEPARVLVGGAGLSGIQTCGEVAEFRDAHDVPIEITLVEALEEILPGHDEALQRRVRRLLRGRGVEILTDDPITEAEDDVVRFDGRDPLAYDVFVWTGGITGRPALEGAALDTEHNRIRAGATFETSDDRVFAVGDTALLEVEGRDVPPTAQAAWDAADVAGENVARAIEGRELRTWTYRDKGTVLSVGEDAVAHDVLYVPVRTFDSTAARLLKKAIGARWIASVASLPRAVSAWPVL